MSTGSGTGADRLRVAIVASWYPSARHSVNGIFVRDQAEVLATRFDVGVVAPHVLSLRSVARGELRAGPAGASEAGVPTVRPTAVRLQFAPGLSARSYEGAVELWPQGAVAVRPPGPAARAGGSPRRPGRGPRRTAARHPGRLVAEALATGRPVVTTASRGPEAFVTEALGIVVPRGDAAALAVGMGRVPAFMGRFDPAATRRRIVQRFGPIPFVESVGLLYREVLVEARGANAGVGGRP